MSNDVWTLRVVYCEGDPTSRKKMQHRITHWKDGDDLINKAAGREPIGSGQMLGTSERDLEYEFKTFPSASRAMQRISKLQWIKSITLNRQRIIYQ